MRHHGSHREDDGAIDWNTLLPMLCRDYENASEWTNPEWSDLLRTGSDKKRFQCCLNSDVFIHYMRAIQGHSGGTKVDPTLLDNVPIVVPGLSTGSSSSIAGTSPTSRRTRLMILRQVQQQHDVEVQAFRYWERQKTQNTIKKGHRSVQGDLLRDLQEWLEDFTANPKDEGVSASRDTPASTSRESGSEPPRKVVSRKHRIFTLARNALVMQHLAQNTLVT